MSDPKNPNDAPATTGFDWSKVTTYVSEAVSVLGPLVEAADPAAAVAIGIGTKIVQGMIAAEPAAVALYKQITSGSQPTPAQLAEYSANYEAAYQQLDADIKAALAALPPATA